MALAWCLFLSVACGSADPLERVRELHEEGRFADSLEPLRDLIAARPDDAELQFRYGFTLRRLRRPDDAVWSLSEARKHPDWALVADRELAAAAQQAANWPAAIEAASRVLELQPDDVAALTLRGVARLEQSRDIEAAIADFDRVLALAPDRVDVRISRVSALLLEKRLDEVEREIQAIQELLRAVDPRNGEVARLCVAGAVFAKERERLEAAEALFESCLEEFPDSSLVLEERVAFLDERDESQRATDLLRAALQARPDAANLRHAVARRLRAAGETTEAERVLRAGTHSAAPAVAADAWDALADHFMQLDDPAGAAAALGESLALRAEPTALQRLAYADMLAASGAYARAAEIADALSPPYGDIVWARILLTQRKPAEALERFDAALRLWPNNGGARYHAARAAERVGDFERAVAEYRQAIRSGAKESDAGLDLARLHAAEGDHVAAARAVAHHLEAFPRDAEALELAVRVIDLNAVALRSYLGRSSPGVRARLIAVLAERTAAERGDEAAIRRLQSSPNLDLRDPAQAAALRELVERLAAVGRVEEAVPVVEAALAAQPEASALHEIQGRLLARVGTPESRVRAAYQRALELDPENARALAALGMLAARAGDVDAALAWYDRAHSADPGDPAALRAATELLAGSDRVAELEARLAELLWQHPYEAKAALLLARLRLRAGETGEEVRSLALRAARFGKAAEAATLLTRLAAMEGR